MEQKAFQLLQEAEHSWWYKGRARVVRAAAHRAGITRGGAVLDFGAGYGGMFETLRTFGTPVFAFEPEVSALRELRGRGYEEVHADAAQVLQKTYQTIGLFDV